ncbi:MAG: hypothetical protein J6X16_08305 [Bacteroidales bacterium]|nr:hypothetical protein [Bacteroidales bacterium]
MFRYIRKSRFTKVFAMVLLVSFLAELMQPAQLYALTGGPSQPEMAGFTPVSTDNMVDLFSGDFHYTIPIMTVPGPNGGFPINLNYNSNIGMEHEASWVGLGWNLNPGAINRQVRGIPDDFCGDEIVKTYKRRDNNTFLFSMGGSGEVFGADFGIGISQSQSFIYNTYKGITLCQRFGIAASYVRDGDVKDKRSKILTANLGFGLDSDNGVTTSFSMNGNAKNIKLGFNYGYNSKSGTYTFSNQVSVNAHRGSYNSFGTSYSSAASLPPIHLPLTSASSGLSGQVGGSGMYLEGFGSLSCNLVFQKTPNQEIGTSAYGLLYLDHADNESLQDFNREKELCVDGHSKNLPLPVMTNDVYVINGELMSGSFRAYRSDYGHFYDNEVHVNSYAPETGVDVGFGGGVQIGANLSFSSGDNYTGDWDGADYCSAVSFKDKSGYKGYCNLYSNVYQSISPTLYEPFYFKMSGEQTSSDLNHMDDVGGGQAVYFPLSRQFLYNSWNGVYNNYTISNSLSEGTMTHFEQENRTKRVSNIEYKTGKTGTNGKNHHIKEFSIVNADGERFTYGKTLYNHVEKEVQFSIGNHNSTDKTTTVYYSRNNADGSQRVGKEKLYSCTSTPSYAYSYLITSITSPDYVDINQNGEPDEVDLGYWVKFSYTDKYCSNNPYGWRFPYEGANYFMGDRSNQTDDMGSYNYGTKDIAYLDTIETKTHKAVFYISQRNDALGVGDEYMGGKDANQRLYKLDSIRLFSKEDMSIPIKTAVFEYDYFLCRGVPNNANNNANTFSYGKLTLRKVYFKYALSEKGRQNPYCFRYDGINPDYAPEKMDRWGNYKGNANYFEHYTTQDSSTANGWASAWLLTGIDLPEGGTVTIDYESDDYAYVQNRQAMYMAEVNNRTSFNKEGDGKYYIYFNKKPEVDAKEYVSGFKYNLMYFKMAVRYEENMVPDYIQGYVEINPNNAQNINPTYGRVEVKAFNAYDIHPVWFLALQQLKNNRPDLMFNNADADENQSDGQAFFRALVSGGVIDKVTAMYGNDKFYRHCTNEGDYKTLAIGLPEMPSYIRVNVPDKIKFGGGSRVKSVSISDNWGKSDTSVYRQDYFYRKTENGKLISSGVAEYEPMVCPEENAMRYPVYDKVKGLFFVEDEMYSEEPYGESYFPAANVGYSQVVIKTHTPGQVNHSTAGIQRHEFYTAKDFPISVSQTTLSVMEDQMPNILRIITGGFMQISSSAYSQGYLIELNDMHGKQKAISTVPYIPLREEHELIPAVEQSAYTSKVEYEYFSKTVDSIRKIDNQVDVLLGDCQVEKRILGQTFDFVVDQRENHSESIGGGASAQFMLATYYPPLVGASAMPSFDCFEETVKSVAVTKVIYNTGILKTTRAYNKGSVITTENLQFDPYTGKALLTSVTNEFGQPVYNYSMPAYWYHHNMGSSAENYRAMYFSNPTLPNRDSTFWQYDVIPYNNGSDVTIKTISGNGMATCWLPNNNTDDFSANGKEIHRSRFSNQLNAEAASLVSLVCPTDPNNRRLKVLEDFNEQRDSCFVLHNCDNSAIDHARLFYDNTGGRLYFFRGDYSKICDTYILQELLNGCTHYLSFAVNLVNEQIDFTNYFFVQTGKIISIYQRNPQQYVNSFRWNDPNGYFPECLDGVLQASATEYQSVWDYDYSDAGIGTPVNENYLGIPNIYRSLRANLYVTDRNQTGQHDQYNTNIAYDGTFSSFAFFSYGTGNKENMQKPWTWTAEITKYSPFNFEIENKNALDIYSSALYGYKQSLVTAVANNARYEEIGFDSFENDSQLSIGSPRGHLQVELSPNTAITTEYAHSGQKSLKTRELYLRINENTSLQLQSGKEYVFSCWVRKDSCNTLGNLGESFVLTFNGYPQIFTKEAKVECWQRVEFTFKAETGVNTIQLRSSDIFSDIYVDDIRMAPANATIKSYVYDPQNYRLVAELDENNYATFYNYDEEGVLVQVKKETERGVMTIKTTRQNLKKNNSTNL